MKAALLLNFFLVSAAFAATSRRSRPAGAAATSGSTPALSPQQSNPPDPGNAFTPRIQSGCLSNIGIGAPTAVAYYHPGDIMTFTIRADMFLPDSDTGAEIVDPNENTVATVIPTFPTLNYTTITTTVPLPTQATPGTYWLRFQQTYSNTFARGMRTQTMQVQMVVSPAGSPTPAPPVTTSVNPLGMTVTVPPMSGTSVPAAGGSSVPASGSNSSAASGGASGGTAATTTTGSASTTSSGSDNFISSFGIIMTAVLGFIGLLAVY